MGAGVRRIHQFVKGDFTIEARGLTTSHPSVLLAAQD
jgi:hypothetical protein